MSQSWDVTPIDSFCRLTGAELLAAATLLKKHPRTLELTIRGPSMGLALPDGSAVRFEFAPTHELVEGKIAVCVEGANLYAHRIVHRSFDPECVVTMGDAEYVCDLPVPDSSVVGLVTEVCIEGKWQAVAAPATLSARRQRTAKRNTAMVRLCLSRSLALSRRAASLVRRYYRVKGNLRRRLGRLQGMGSGG